MEESGLTLIVFLIVPISHHRAAAYRQKISCQDVRLLAAAVA